MLKLRLLVAALAVSLASTACGGHAGPLPTVQPATSDAFVRIAAASSGGVCPNGNALFVPNFDIDTVSVVDPASGALRTTFTTGGFSGPTGAAYNPANNVLYVANWWTTTISAVNATTGAPAGVIANANLVGPYGLAVGPDGKLYAANNGSTTVSIVDTAHNNAVLPQITGLNGPGGVAVNASRLYVSNMQGNSVSIFDTTHNNAPAGSIGGLSHPFGVALAGTKLYVANEGNNTISVFDTSNNNAKVATLSGNSLNMPFGLASDGTTIYAADAPTSTISKFAVAGNAASGTISGGGITSPYGAAIGCSPPIPSSPPAPPAVCPNVVFIANYGSNSISIADPSSHAVLGTISGKGVNGPISVGYDRIKQYLYVGNWNDDTVGVFNAATNANLGVLAGNGIDAPYGVGVGNEGRLYVADLDAQNGAGVSRFDTNNAFAPLSPLTALPYAAGIAVGVGKVFATDYFHNAIGVFDTTNNDAFLQKITGNELRQPFGLAAVGISLYVANSGSNALSEYAQSNGALLRTIADPSLKTPYGMAFDTATIYAVNANATVSTYGATTGTPLGAFSGAGMNESYGIATGRSCGVLKKTMDYRRSIGGSHPEPFLETEIRSRWFSTDSQSAAAAQTLADPLGAQRRAERRSRGPAAFLRGPGR